MTEHELPDSGRSNDQLGPSIALPYELAAAHDGIRVFWDRFGPREFPEHDHPEIEVAMSFGDSSGPAIWQTQTGRRVTHRMEPGYVSVLPSHQPHSGIWEREAEVLVFYLDPGFFLKTLRDSEMDEAVELVGSFTVGDLPIRGLGAALREEISETGTPTGLYLESVATVLAAYLARRHSTAAGQRLKPPGDPSRAALRRATDYIEENLATNLTLAAIAGVAGLSPYHFSRTFKGYTGLPPYRYVIACRIERARGLLVNTDLPLDEVARRTGFTDQSHLARQMRRLLGVSPGSLRRRS